MVQSKSLEVILDDELNAILYRPRPITHDIKEPAGVEGSRVLLRYCSTLPLLLNEQLVVRSGLPCGPGRVTNFVRRLSS